MKLSSSIITLFTLALAVVAATTPTPPTTTTPAPKDVKDGTPPPAGDAAKPADTKTDSKAATPVKADNGSPTFVHISAALGIIAGITAFAA